MPQRSSLSLTGCVVGHALRVTGATGFRGKGRLVRYWMNARNEEFVGLRRLPGGGSMTCTFRVPYEAMVWICQEEEPELRRLTAMLRPGDHFVDCGAGVGLWTLTAAACVGDTGFVTAFEPNPAAHERLVANLAGSRGLGRRVRAVEMAVGDSTDDAFIESSTPYNVARITDRAGRGAHPVKMISLDGHLPPDQPVHGLKIDVEGCEYRVLAGARELIGRWRPWIWAELNVEISGAACFDEWPVYQLLSSLGYRCAWPRVASSHRFTGYINCLFQPT